MKTRLILIASIGLANPAGAADHLTIAAAHGLPDYTKFVAANDTSQRGFAVTFAPGDFNEDGRLDLVVQTVDVLSPNLTPWGAKVFLQDSSGGFQEKNEYLLPTTGITWHFEPRDFNEDGHLDILMEEANQDLLLLPGKGDGTFLEPAFLGLAAAGFFAVADLNGDRHLDIVAARRDGGVGVFFGAGNGTFTAASTLDADVTASYPRIGEIMVADVNKDGRTDVVVGSQPGNSLDGTLKVFFNKGDGTFLEAVSTPKVATRMSALGDFNGDGLLDYAGSGGAPEQLQIWIGQGDGHFTRRIVYSLTAAFAAVYDVSVADLNYDGILDVLVSGQASSTVYAAPIAIFLGKGDGTFQPRTAFTQANGTRTINMGPKLLDFDGDGLLDILSLCWTAERPVTREAVMIARSLGVRRDSTVGSLINVQATNETEPSLARVLETSDDLATWTALATNTPPTANWSITDTSSVLGQRFYRTRKGGLGGD